MVRLAFVLLLGGCNMLFGLLPVEGLDETPTVIATAHGSCASCSTKSITIDTIEVRSRGLLLVHVVSTLAGPGDSPPSNSVTHGGRPLTLVNRATISGTGSMPLLELWKLQDPEVGNHAIEVTLASQAVALLVGATEIEGVADDPVRGFSSNGGESQLAANTIASADSDLVIDAVCAGDSIGAPGMDQTLVWLEARGNVASCGNLATSVRPGAATVTLDWRVNSAQSDWWLDLAAAIVPAN